MNARILIGVLLPLLATACGWDIDKLPRKQKIEGLRVFGLVADQPEAAPGQIVTITPVVTDIDGAGRALRFAAEACFYESRLNRKLTCGERAIGRAEGAVDTLTAPDYTGAGNTFQFQIPPYPGELPSGDGLGVPVVIFYRITAADGTSAKGMKSIVVSLNQAKTKNPKLNGLDTGGLALGRGTPRNMLLRPLMDLTGLDESDKYGARVIWYASEGKFSHMETPRNEPNTYIAPADEVTRPIVLLLLARSGRGGQAYYKRVLN